MATPERPAAPSFQEPTFDAFRRAVPHLGDPRLGVMVELADRDRICSYVELLEVVADDALALLDLHISDEQRQELGVRIINRLTRAGRLRDARS